MTVTIDTEVNSFVAIGDKVLVQLDPVDEITDGGVVKPSQVMDRERSGRGVVVSAGPDTKFVEAGMVVFVPYWSACVIKLDGDDYHLFLEKDIGGYLNG